MVTQLQRVQALLDPSTYEHLQCLVASRGVSMSSLASQLIVAALDTEEIKAELECISNHKSQDEDYISKGEVKSKFVEAAVEGHDLNTITLQKLLELAECLDDE